MPFSVPSDADRWSPAWTVEQGEQRAWELLRDTFGESADKVVSAPGMVNIIGDHTDYNGGLSLATVLAHRAYVAAKSRDDSKIRVVRRGVSEGASAGSVWYGDLEDLVPGHIPGWPARIASVLWSLMERGFSGTGMDIAIASSVPRQSGMSSSAAVSAGIALAANSLWRLALETESGRAEMAEACVEGESSFLGINEGGAPSGGLDLHTVLRCEPGEALLLDFIHSPPLAQHYPLYFPEYGLALMMIDTRVRPASNSEISAERRAECAQAASALGVASLRELELRPQPLRDVAVMTDELLRKRARHVLHENDRVRQVLRELAGTGPAHERFVAIGKCMYRSHASLDVDFDLSSELLNMTVEAAFQAGALGAHLTGWGRGGAVLALVRRSEAERLSRTLDDVYRDRGLDLPHYSIL
jgi:galactokinase